MPDYCDTGARLRTLERVDALTPAGGCFLCRGSVTTSGRSGPLLSRSSTCEKCDFQVNLNLSLKGLHGHAGLFDMYLRSMWESKTSAHSTCCDNE